MFLYNTTGKKMSKSLLLEKLYEPYRKCTSHPLQFPGSTNIVLGHGNPDATFMIIGEAPGQEEDEQGIPFVGRSGRLLTKVLTSLDIHRQDIFITNVVKYRPPCNRKPTKKEIALWTDLLLFKEINIIKPKVICTLGSSAVAFLLKQQTIKMSELRGKPIRSGKLIIFPTYHPAYILRNINKLEEFTQDIKNAYSISKQ